MSTDAPPHVPVAPDDVLPARPRSPGSVAWAVAVAAGVVAIVGALLLPFAPVAVSTPEVRWPVDPRDPAPTMLMLTAYEPVDMEARFSCRAARAAATTPDGVVLSTMGPASRDVDQEALTVVARDEAVTVRSGGSELFAGPLPPGDCRILVAGDAAAVRVLLDGALMSTTPSRQKTVDAEELPESGPEPGLITALPQVDALRTSAPPLPGASADDLSVRLTLEDTFDHTPGPTKTALIAVIVTALLGGAVAMSVPAARPAGQGADARGRDIREWARRRVDLTTVRLRNLRPRIVDVVVPAVLLVWLFLAPRTDDDGYYSAMAANVPFTGYVTNYYQLYNQGFTPFSWPYYALSWWQTTFGVAPVVLRIPALVLGLGTFFLARAFLARTTLLAPGTPRSLTPALARLTLAVTFLAWWLPYNMGVRPEPVVGFFVVATLVALAEGLDRRRLALLGLAVGLATAGLMAAPTGFIALAPLLAAAPAAARLIRDGAVGWGVVAGRWVVVLAPAAVGSLLGFADGAYRDFVRSQEIFAPVQRAMTWHEELHRYAGLLDPGTHFGSYARRAAVLVSLLALVCFLLLLVAARARNLVVPSRLPLAGWTVLLAFVLLLPTPSKPSHHFGAFAGIGAVFLTLVLVIGPRLVAALDRERRVPQVALVAGAFSAVMVFALAGHGRNLWPWTWGLGMPSFGDHPAVRGVRFDQPLWWALGLAVIAGGVALVAHLRVLPWRRLGLAIAVPAMVCVFLVTFTGWMLGDFARAAARTSTTWSPQVDAWRDPAGAGCGLAGQIDVLDPRSTRALVPAVVPGAPRPAPVVPPDRADASARELRTEPFVPGAFFPGSPPPTDVPAEVPVWGSFLVPEEGANADARTGAFTTDWFRLPPASPESGLAVAVSGRTGNDVTLRAEYGRVTPDTIVSLGSRLIGTDAESLAWRTVPLLDEAAPPAEADAVRLVAADDSTTTGGWLAFSAPLERRWVPLQQFLPPDGAVGVAWQLKTLFPCQRQPRQQHGVTEPAVAAVGYGPTVEAALSDWTFDPERGGLLGHAEREAGATTLLTTRVRDVGDAIDDVQVLDLRQPYPGGGYDLIRDRRVVSGLPEEGLDLDPDLTPPAPPADG